MYELSIVNSYFKEGDQLVTSKSDNPKTKINYILMRVNNRMLCKD